MAELSELKKRLQDAKTELQALTGIACEPDSKVATRREELELIITGLEGQIRRLENGRWIHKG